MLSKPNSPIRPAEETASSGGAGARQVGGLAARISGHVRKAAAILTTAGLITLVSLGTAVPSQASGSSSGLNSDEVLNCYFNAKACVYANDAKNWAESITEWKFPLAQESNHNTRADAFRHCSWSAALSNRVGFDTAWQILSTHETSSKHQPEAELRMDMTNNYTGARIGLEARSKGGNDQWGWIMNKCEKLARAGQLEVLH